MDAVLGINRILVAHDTYQVSTFNLSGILGAYSTTLAALDVDDVALDPLDGVYGLDKDEGNVWRFNPDVGLAQWSAAWTGLSEVTAIGTDLTSDEPWFAIANTESIEFYALNSGTIDNTVVLSTVTHDYSVVQLVSSGTGYHWAGTSNGTLALLTDKPWVYDVAVTFESDVVEDKMDTGNDSDTDSDMDTDTDMKPGAELTTVVLTLSFTTNEAGSYNVAVNGTWEGGGTSISTGSECSGDPC